MMKKLMTMLGFGLVLMAFTVQSDTEDIVNALKQGNPERFSKYFDNILDMKLPEKDEIKNISKIQAGITIKGFFDENGIKGFEVTNQRELGGTMYITGKLQGASKTFNLTLMMKTAGNTLSIITVRIN